MASPGRSAYRSVDEVRSVVRLLFEEGPRFEFFQAVSLLQNLARNVRPSERPDSADLHSTGSWITALEQAAHRNSAPLLRPGEGPRKLTSSDSVLSFGFPVRFRGAMDWQFPHCDINRIVPPQVRPRVPTHVRPARERPMAEMMVTFLSLGGASGPLPEPFTDAIIDRTLRGDYATRDFLDIFHHRLLSLLYENRRVYSLVLGWETALDSPVARSLLSLSGLDFRSRDAVQKRLPFAGAFVPYFTGFFSQQTRPAEGLEKIIRSIFGIETVVRPFRGRWLPVEPGDETRLGRAAGYRLGQSINLGQRFYDANSMFRVELGPLSQVSYESLLPCADTFSQLDQMTRFYVGLNLDVEFVLRLSPRAIAPCRLRRGYSSPGEWQHPGLLGWTTFLGRNSGKNPAPDCAGMQSFVTSFWNSYRDPLRSPVELNLDLNERGYPVAVEVRNGRGQRLPNVKVHLQITPVRNQTAAPTDKAFHFDGKTDGLGRCDFSSDIFASVPDDNLYRGWNVEFVVAAPGLQTWTQAYSWYTTGTHRRANGRPGDTLVIECRNEEGDPATTERFVKAVMKVARGGETLETWGRRFGIVAAKQTQHTQRFRSLTEAIRAEGERFLKMVHSRIPYIRISQDRARAMRSGRTFAS